MARKAGKAGFDQGSPRNMRMNDMELKLLVLALLTIAIRLFGNASVIVLTRIDPRPVAAKKRLLHWGISLGAALLAMALAPAVADL